MPQILKESKRIKIISFRERKYHK